MLNKNGESNKVLFTGNRSNINEAEEKIYQTREYQTLTNMLDKIANEGGSYSIGVHNCAGKPCIEIDIYIDVKYPIH